MKLSFFTLGCPDWNLETVVKRAVEYGYDGVELRVKGKQHVDVDLTPDERKQVRRLFADNKVEVAALGTYAFFNSDKKEELESNRNGLLKCIDLAVDLGAPFIRSFIGDPKGLPEEQVIRNTVDYLGQVVQVAESKGITILLENHAPWKAIRIREVLDKVNHRNLASLLDVHNAILSGEDPIGTYQILRDKVKFIHVKDAIEKNGEHKLCLTGEGSIPLAELVGLLKKDGYQGYLSFEWEKMWNAYLDEPEVAFPGYVKYLRKLI